MRPNSGDSSTKGLTLRNPVYKISNLILPIDRHNPMVPVGNRCLSHKDYSRRCYPIERGL